MKGFLFVCALAAVTFGWKWVYARLMAKRDPVDAGLALPVAFEPWKMIIASWPSSSSEPL